MSTTTSCEIIDQKRTQRKSTRPLPSIPLLAIIFMAPLPTEQAGLEHPAARHPIVYTTASLPIEQAALIPRAPLFPAILTTYRLLYCWYVNLQLPTSGSVL